MEACEDENLEFFMASGEDDDCQTVGDIMMDPENMGCMNVSFKKIIQALPVKRS